jgi:nucleoside-diphosphate-sugar epimerase
MLEHGWQVRVFRQSATSQPDAPQGIHFEQLDRNQAGMLGKALKGGADAVIDTVAYTAAHGRQWLEIEDDIGSLSIISSVSVYCDADGRTMDQAQGKGFPAFPAAIAEDQPTIAPSEDTYPSNKSALEQVLLNNARCPVALLRPGAIHGEHSRQPREWWFIKRILDGRRDIPLAYNGAVRFHTSAASNVAKLCRITAEKQANGAFNIVDPEALSTRQIGQVIASVYGVELNLVPLEGAPRGLVGQHPWSVPQDMIMDMTRAHALGYQPNVRYADSIDAVCRSAQAIVKTGITLPGYLGADFFDYPADDDVLNALK